MMMLLQWHLGFYAKELTPTYRGFDSFYGYLGGKEDYWDHTNQGGKGVCVLLSYSNNVNILLYAYSGKTLS